jgi:hypothetical protein
MKPQAHGSLPFTVAPHRAEGLYSWLMRLAAPYRLKPWQLLHELKVGTFAGRDARYQHPLHAFLTGGDLRNLAHQTRVDPSRIMIDRLAPPDWLLASDEWRMHCHQCAREDRRAGIAAYERLIWRNSSHTICQCHAAPLVRIVAARSGEGAEEVSPIELTDLERNLLVHLMRFESQIRGALRGNVPVEAAGTLTAGEFLRVVQDLLTFAVARWDADPFPQAQTIEQQAYHLGSHAPTLFPRHQLKRTKYCHDRHQPTQLRHLADPAARRAALWLTPSHLVRPVRTTPSCSPTWGHAARRILRITAACLLGMVGRTCARLATTISIAALAWVHRRY